MKSLARLFLKSPVRDWVWLFIAVNTLITIPGSVNPASRWATLAALVEDGSVRVDHYLAYTCDWARTPGGHYYSNKAPGPVLLGYPIFRLLDKINTGDAPDRSTRDARRARELDNTMHTLSIFTQVIPFAIVTLLLISELQKLSVPLVALHLAAVSLLFGNTASLFANTYFGHTMSAAFVLFTLFAIHRRMPVRIGLFFGLAALCDYACLLLALPLVVALAMTKQLSWRRLWLTFAGGLGPLLFFAAYHKLCFGSPFTLGQKYVNPQFVDVPKSVPALWGVIRFLPNFKSMQKLIYSPERGVAYTQTWVLVCLLLALVVVWMKNSNLAQRYTLRWLSAFTISGFISVLWLNSSFGGWHGGDTCGPRYLASILPAFAIMLPLLYVRATPWLRELLFVSLVPALALYILVFSCAHVLAPEYPLHEYYLTMLFKSDAGGRLFRVLLILMGAGWAGFRARKSIVRARLEPDLSWTG